MDTSPPPYVYLPLHPHSTLFREAGPRMNALGAASPSHVPTHQPPPISTTTPHQPPPTPTTTTHYLSLSLNTAVAQKIVEYDDFCVSCLDIHQVHIQPAMSVYCFCWAGLGPVSVYLVWYHRLTRLSLTNICNQETGEISIEYCPNSQMHVAGIRNESKLNPQGSPTLNRSIFTCRQVSTQYAGLGFHQCGKHANMPRSNFLFNLIDEIRLRNDTDLQGAICWGRISLLWCISLPLLNYFDSPLVPNVTSPINHIKYLK